MDSYSLYDGFFSGISCNYPEAYTEASAYYDNITVITSKDRTNFKSPSYLNARLPGNITFKNIDVYDTYGLVMEAIPPLGTSLVAL